MLSGDPFEGFAFANAGAGTTGPAEVTQAMLQSVGFTYFYRSIGNKGSKLPPQIEDDKAQTINVCGDMHRSKTAGQQQSCNRKGLLTVHVYQPANSMLVYSIGQAIGEVVNGQPRVGAFGATIPPGVLDPEGIFFAGNITTPPEFALGNGSVGFVQMITPNNYENPGANGQPFIGPLNGLFCLDGNVPYGDLLSANGLDQFEGDGPSAPVYVTSTLSDTFDMYMLFLPPPNGTTATTLVSLATIHWYVTCTGTYNAANNPPWTYPAYPNLNILADDDDATQTSFLPTWMTVNKSIR